MRSAAASAQSRRSTASTERGNALVPEQGGNISTSMHDTKDPHVLAIGGVHDDVVAHRKAACTREQVITGTADLRVSSQKREAGRDRIDQPLA